MKNLLLILVILISSCAGKRGDITLTVYAINDQNCPINLGSVWIYYSAKKVKKIYNDDAYITDGYATFSGLSKGNYMVRLKPESFREDCTIQLRLAADRTIYLREGQNTAQ